MPAPYLSLAQRSLLVAARKQELLAYRSTLGTLTMVAGGSMHLRPLGVRMAIRAGYVTLFKTPEPDTQTNEGAWYRVGITDLGINTLEDVEQARAARRAQSKRAS